MDQTSFASRTVRLLLLPVVCLSFCACGSGGGGGDDCDPACEAGFACLDGTCLDVDECLTDSTGCGTDAHCVNIEGSFECVCDPGYQGDGTTCVDADECAENSDDCAPEAACTNTGGGFRCACPTGTVGDGTACFDVDECLLGLDDCHADAVCLNTEGSFDCECAAGYAGDGRVCADVDECFDPLMDCGPHAVCANDVGAFHCECDPGFAMDGMACVDVDECADGTHDCHPDASCDNTDGAFDCACLDGFTGDGNTCTDVDECIDLGIDCGPDGACLNDPGGFHCDCSPGFAPEYSPAGGTCLDLDECTDGSNDCHADADCENTPGGFTCTCRDGYTGNGTVCADVDECVDVGLDCGLNGSCENEPGTFHCNCDPGFVQDGDVCLDVDECADGTHDCAPVGSECTNLPGGFDCACLIGFTGDGLTCTSEFGDFGCRRALHIDGLDAEVVDGELLVEVDSAALITAGKLRTDCGDLRVVDTDAVTPLDYWIEGGCGTDRTQVWVRVPYLPIEGGDLYLLYCEPGQASVALPYSGMFILPSTAGCQGSWSHHADLDGRFPMGSDVYGATGGGDHEHTFTCQPDTGSSGFNVQAGVEACSPLAQHVHAAEIVPLPLTENLRPPFLTTPYCSTDDLYLPAGVIGLFVQARAGWQKVDALDGRFPLGDPVFGFPGGTATHSHTTPFLLTDLFLAQYVSMGSGGIGLADCQHLHVIAPTPSEEVSHLPPYYNLIHATNSQDGPAPISSLVMGDDLPPLGWRQASQLNGRFPQGSPVGGTSGGSQNHRHHVDLVLESTLGTSQILMGSDLTLAWLDHTHACTGYSSFDGHLPEYLEVIFFEKLSGLLSPGMSLALGPEETF